MRLITNNLGDRMKKSVFLPKWYGHKDLGNFEL
jgi:hypothetical protein